VERYVVHKRIAREKRNFVKANYSMTPTIYLIHGFIGSGKTTFAKQLEDKTKAKRFTPDEIITKRYGDNLTLEKIKEANVKVKNEIWQKVKELIASNADVILDYGFWKKEQRQEITRKAKEIGGRPIFYEVLCDPETMKYRALNRNSANDLYIDEERYNLYLKRFEPMEYNEDRITVHTD